MQLKLIFCITIGWSYPIINITRKSLMPNLIKTAINHNAEMTCHMVRRSRATTSCQLQTSHHPQATTTSVQSVVTQHIEKGSHAQQKSTSAGYVINLATLRVNAPKRSHLINRSIDNLRHIRYR